MNTYIKYKRFENTFDAQKFEVELQTWFDNLIKDGWVIINYEELATSITKVPEGSTTSENVKVVTVIIVAGKTSNQIKNIL